MTLALETNVLIALQKQEGWAVEHYRAAVASGEQPVIPAVVRYEARRSLLKSEYARRLQVLDELLAFLPTLDLDRQTADLAADLHHQLRSIGQLLEDADLLIAATAIRYNASLVTHNLRHFRRVPGLHLVDWQQENPIP